MLEGLIARFLARDFGAVLSHYDFPVEFTLDGRHVQMARPRDLEGLLLEHGRSFRLAGLTDVRFAILAIEVPQLSRFRVWVDYQYMNRAGVTAIRFKHTMHLRDKHGRLIIEAVHVQRLPAEGLAQWTPSRVLTA
jgi:hypothetical protein